MNDRLHIIHEVNGNGRHRYSVNVYRDGRSLGYLLVCGRLDTDCISHHSGFFRTRRRAEWAVRLYERRHRGYEWREVPE